MQNEQFNPLQGLWSTVCRLFLLTTFFVGFGLVSTPEVKGIEGAIFTTTAGGIVNGNTVYNTKADVYLNGGPAAGGPAISPAPGDYFCQVTTPNGGVLGFSNTAIIHVTSTGSFAANYRLIDILYTASSGFTVKGYDDTTNNGGEYKVWISSTSDFGGGDKKTDNFKVKVPEIPPPPPPPPPGDPRAELCAIKFYDSNANGLKDSGEVTINDWLVIVNGTISTNPLVTSLVLSTPACTFVKPGVFSIDELSPEEEHHWVHTTALVSYNGGAPFVAPGSTLSFVPNITLNANDHVTVFFGNVCIGAGGGKTLGFWSNKNGQKALGVSGGVLPNDVITFLNNLNLRKANGTDFVATTDYNYYRNWLLGGNATNMSYMLSVQLAAMALNVQYGSVNGAALVHAPDLLPYLGLADGLSEAGFITVNKLMLAANIELGLHELAVSDPALTGSDSAFRAYQEALKDALDDANNNLIFVQSVFNPLLCPFSFVIPNPTPTL